jgi:hypothetical protein
VQPNVKIGREPPPAPARAHAPAVAAGPVAPPPGNIVARATHAVRAFLRDHGHKLWWLHSIYALGLGVGVVAFAHRGFDHARWMAVALGLAWLLLVLFFRLFA